MTSKPVVVLSALVLAVAVAAARHAVAVPGKPTAASTAAEPGTIARGKYLVAVGGCNDCHSPKIFGASGPMPDPARLLSGHPRGQTLPSMPAGFIGPTGWGAVCNNDGTAWVGPWGTSFAMNLTPDVDTGVGSWNEAMFVKAIRTGKHMGEGRPILPTMPWAEFAGMSDADLSAIFGYLRSLEPVSNAVPEPLPPPVSPSK
ncbi:MAG TPA: diheme cytochrome c-553 [Verrucomicrobiae bacterium]|nr:diheme cytochrome c-553 [Verrucomicrobiae bacterium]